MTKQAFVALVTCFNEDETINYQATRAQVRRQVEAGNNIMCAGTNGDFSALTFEEKVRLTEEVVDEVGGRSRVIVNAGVSEKATGEISLGGGYSTDAGALAGRQHDSERSAVRVPTGYPGFRGRQAESQSVRPLGRRVGIPVVANEGHTPDLGGIDARDASDAQGRAPGQGVIEIGRGRSLRPCRKGRLDHGGRSAFGPLFPPPAPRSLLWKTAEFARSAHAYAFHR